MTSPLPATCARVLRENTGVCVGVRRPLSGGLRYISALTGGVLFLCLPALKSMNMAETGGTTAASQCLGGGGGGEGLTQTPKFDVSSTFFYVLRCNVRMSAQIWV